MSVRTVLRIGTRAAHENVERRFSVFDLTSRDGYRNFLAAQASAVIALEDALEYSDVQTFLPDWSTRRRTSAILTDLAAMGCAAPVAQVVPPLHAMESQLGALYVLEGSQLGARVLLQRVMSSEDEGVRSATRFLRHGNSVPNHWGYILEVLEREGSRRDVGKILESANAAFGIFENAVEAICGAGAARERSIELLETVA